MNDTNNLYFIGTYFILLCVGIYAITFVLRKLIEVILDNPNVPASKNGWFWTEFVLPSLPIVVGAVFCILAVNYPYPTACEGIWARALIGLAAGSFSSTVYRIVLASINQKGASILSSSSTNTTSTTTVSPASSSSPSTITTEKISTSKTTLPTPHSVNTLMSTDDDRIKRGEE